MSLALTGALNALAGTDDLAEQGAAAALVERVDSFVSQFDATDKTLSELNTWLAAPSPLGVKRLVGAASIDGPLVIASDTRLDASNATITLTAATNMLQSAGVAAGTRDSNITVIGGTWARGANAGTNVNAHIMRFRKVDGLTIRDAEFTSSAGKFAVSIADCFDFTVENLRFATHSDGVHLMGPCARGVIRGMYGTTGDDFVAITPTDYAGYNDTAGGDVTDITIEDIYPTGCLSAVKVLGGTTGASRRINVRRVGGTCTGGSGGIWIGHDTTSTETQGIVEFVRISDVSLIVPNSLNTIYLHGDAIRRVSVEGIRASNASATTALIGVTGSSVVETLTVRDVQVETYPQPILNVGTAAAITTLDASGIVVTSMVTGATTNPMIASINGPVTNLLIADCTVAACTGGEFVRLNANITRAILRGLKVVSTTNAAYAVTVRTAVIGDLTLDGVTGNVPAGSAVQLFPGLTGGITRLSMRGVHWYGGASGSVLYAASTTHTLPNVDMVGCVGANLAWLCDLNTTTELHMAGVTGRDLSNGAFNIRANAVVTLIADACSSLSATIASGGALYSRSFGARIDVSKLTKAVGHMATNTNAALSCGSGPVVGNASALWENVLTHATY